MHLKRILILTVFAVGLSAVAFLESQTPGVAGKRLTRAQKRRAKTFVQRSRFAKPRLKRRFRKPHNKTFATVQVTFSPAVGKQGSSDLPPGVVPMKMEFRPISKPQSPVYSASYPIPGSLGAVTVNGITFRSGDGTDGGVLPDPGVTWDASTRIISGGVSIANEAGGIPTIFNAKVSIREISVGANTELTAAAPTGYSPVFRKPESGVGEYVYGTLPDDGTQVPGTDADGDQRGCVWFFDITTSNTSTAETFTFEASVQGTVFAQTEGFVARAGIGTGRFGHAVGLDGRKLVVSGGDKTNNGSAFTTDTVSYDRTANTWSAPVAASAPAKAGGFAVNALNGVLYLFDGADKTVAPFDTLVQGFGGGAFGAGAGAQPATAPSTVFDGNGVVRLGAAATAADGFSYLMGGEDSTPTFNNKIARFKSVTLGTSTDLAAAPAAIATLSSARSGIQATVDVMGRIFVAGGNIAGAGALTTVQEIDPLRDAGPVIRAVASLPGARTRGQMSVGQDGRIYYFGGLTDTADQGAGDALASSVFQFTVPVGAGTGSWATQPSTLGLQRGVALLMNDNRIHVYGGFDGFTEIHTAFVNP